MFALFQNVADLSLSTSEKLPFLRKSGYEHGIRFGSGGRVIKVGP